MSPAIWPGINAATSAGDSDSSDSESEPHTPISSPSSSSSSNSHHDGDVDDEHRHESSIKTLSDISTIRSYWMAKRHNTGGNPSPPSPDMLEPAWRDKHPVKSFHGALFICLNTVVDPPDVVKTDPCAVLEAWIDPRLISSRKASEVIGNSLQKQFEGLNSRMKFKVYTDPSFDDMEKHCITLRRIAKSDRTLFYYNGHGVPKPTVSGELWVFNKDYSQYIPISIIQLQTWLASPTIYVWDCSSAGNLLSNFLLYGEKRDREMVQKHGGYPSGMRPYMDCIHLAACLPDEQLPMCPELPADLFTSCLTSPIDMALRYFVMNHQLPTPITVSMLSKIPGDLKDRRTPLGELNWILTSITDTIAWTTFPRPIFQKLYRSDLMVAALFRNFLLAERIMKNYHCTPHTYPPLPPTNTHPMWASWDMAIDNCLKQIPAMIAAEEAVKEGSENAMSTYDYRSSDFFIHHLKAFDIWVSEHGVGGPRCPKPFPLVDSLSSSSAAELLNIKARIAPRLSPDELPIILQVLLSNTYRVQALFLICQFMDLGPWAVHLALLIGVFPYVQRLLQAPNQDLRAPLIFIWTRIIAVDDTRRNELFVFGGWTYFAQVLALDHQQHQAPQERQQHGGTTSILPNPTEHRAMCLFILAEMCRNNHTAQNAIVFPHHAHHSHSSSSNPPPSATTTSVFSSAYDALDETDFLLRQWSALCLAQLWSFNDQVKSWALDVGLQDKLVTMLGDDKSPEVRAACLYAIGTLMGAAASNEQKGGGGLGGMGKYDEFTLLRLEITLITGATLTAKYDMSPMVRKELITLLSCAAHEYRGWLIIAGWSYWSEQDTLLSSSPSSSSSPNQTREIIYEWLNRMANDEELVDMYRLLFASAFTIFSVLIDLSLDPHPEVANGAMTVIDWLMACLIESPFAMLPGSDLVVGGGGGRQRTVSTSPQPPQTPRSRVTSLRSQGSSPREPPVPLSPKPQPPPAPPPQVQRSDTSTSTAGRVTSTLKRTSSLANAFVNYAFPSVEETPTHHTPPSPSKSRSMAIIPSTIESSTPTITAFNSTTTPSPPLTTMHYKPPLSTSTTTSNPAPSLASAEFASINQPHFSAVDCFEVLVEEDWQRLRSRRGRESSTSSTPEADQPFPTTSLGTGSSTKEGVLPLRSRFYEWSKEYFIEPQMRQAESDEPGSIDYNKQTWRRHRNESVLLETKTQIEAAENCPWDRQVCSFVGTSGAVMNMQFHAFDTYLALSNETSQVSVWDWTKKRKVISFNCGNPKGTSITSLRWINEEVGAHLLLGSADGVVKIFGKLDSLYEPDPPYLITAFRAIPTLLDVRRGAGLVTGWSQYDGTLLAGGDSRSILPWNAHHEKHDREVLTDSNSMVTSLSFAPGQHYVFAASFGDGVVKLFDRRLDKPSPVVRTYKEHKAWIHKARWRTGGTGNEILSSCVDGEIRLWDLRTSRGDTKWHMHPHGLSAFDVHERANVFASSSAIARREFRTQTTLIQTINKTTHNLGRFNVMTHLHQAPSKPPSKFHTASSSLSFHPNEMLLAIGGVDGHVRVVGCNVAEYHRQETTGFGLGSTLSDRPISD